MLSFVDEAIESILKQEHGDVALVAVDDCSTDVSHPKRIGLVQLLDRFNTVPARRAPVRHGFRKELESDFFGQVNVLEGFLGRDLKAWRVS